jgi:hypothetical protein
LTARSAKLGVLSAALVLALAIGGAVEAWRANEPRFRTLPEAERARLTQNLGRFAKLPAAEQASLREIDGKLAELTADERARVLARMRDYRLWLERQPEPRQTQIALTDPEARIALVDRWWAEASAKRVLAGRPVEVLQISALATQSLRRTALELRLWFALRLRQRTHVLEQPTAVQRNVFLRVVARDPVLAARGLEESRALSLGPEELREALPKKNEVGRPTPARPKLEPIRRAADWKFLRDHEPGPVEPENLHRFEEALPEWVRASFDALPAEAAIHRLKVLYRLTFPAPAEIAASEPVHVPAGPAISPTEPNVSDP